MLYGYFELDLLSLSLVIEHINHHLKDLIRIKNVVYLLVNPVLHLLQI